MKSIIYFPRVFSLTICLVAGLSAIACGPYNPIIPTPEFFAISGPHKTMSDYDRVENISLWQSLTSKRIPLPDIEQAVYRDSWERFTDMVYSDSPKTDNLFYVYLNNSNDSEVTEFLIAAKELEKRWRDTRSPWYYPKERNSSGEIGDFNDIIESCKSYKGRRLRDRYAFQTVRALFASRQYAACIVYSDSAFNDIPDDNLMKRMAQRYVAGCWSRLGDSQRADSVFAFAGDIWSINNDNPVEYMASINPNAPQLMEYIRAKTADSLFMKSMVPLAKAMLKNKKVKNKGDWEFLLAYVNQEYIRKTSLARISIYRALRFGLSSDELTDLARAYKMKLDAETGHSQSLLADLRWIESKCDILCPDADVWIRRIRNIIYANWVPRLWRKSDFSTAILLCGYADNLRYDEVPSEVCNDSDMDDSLTCTMTIEKIRDSEDSINYTDYGCLSFQLMGSLSSSKLITAYGRMMASVPLYLFLRRKARTDNDYYNELIGTLALREENYARAETYLSRVSDHYLRTMNITKAGYLYRNPFACYPSRWTIETYNGDSWEYERRASQCGHPVIPGTKLHFARQMQAYKQAMKYGSTADERGMARLMYAIGRRNSFEECWALTQYWRGSYVGVFYPELQYWDDYPERNYSFLFDYEEKIGHKHTEIIYEREIAAALSTIESVDERAHAEYILGNLATIVKHYGNTTIARYVKTSCDNWKSWI